jgi:hypothetical protein
MKQPSPSSPFLLVSIILHCIYYHIIEMTQRIVVGSTDEGVEGCSSIVFMYVSIVVSKEGSAPLVTKQTASCACFSHTIVLTQTIYILLHHRNQATSPCPCPCTYHRNCDHQQRNLALLLMRSDHRESGNWRAACLHISRAELVDYCGVLLADSTSMISVGYE